MPAWSFSLVVHGLAFRKEKGKVDVNPKKRKLKIIRTNGRSKPTPAPGKAQTQAVDW
jgi:hypothetical protein